MELEFTLKNTMYWVTAILNWLFVKFILGNNFSTFIFYTRSTILIGYSIIHFLFITPDLKNNWVNTPKSSCFSDHNVA